MSDLFVGKAYHGIGDKQRVCCCVLSDAFQNTKVSSTPSVSPEVYDKTAEADQWAHSFVASV